MVGVLIVMVLPRSLFAFDEIRPEPVSYRNPLSSSVQNREAASNRFLRFLIVRNPCVAWYSTQANSMASAYEFGNDPAKVARYRAFWDRAPVPRPLVGFSIKSWFPLQEFAASGASRDRATS